MFEDMLKEDLQQLAEDNDLPTSGTKSTLADRLREAGVPEERSADVAGTDVELDGEANEQVGFGDQELDVHVLEEATEKELDVVPLAQPAPGTITTASLKGTPAEDESTPAQKGYSVDEQGRRLVKMTRKKVMHGISNGRAFTLGHPFLLMDAEEAEELIEQPGFRYATMEEAKEYYS